MYRDDSDFLKSIIDSYYSKGLAALKTGEKKKAKKLLYSAAENTLLLAKRSTIDRREQLIERADEICEFADAIDDAVDEVEETKYNNQTNTGSNNNDKSEKSFASCSYGGITFDDVVGLNDVKEEIRRLAIYPRQYPEVYEQFKKRRGGGILLYGVPGTGKTMIANAIANELGAVFYSVKCSDILSKWFGEAEQNIKELFDEAEKNPVAVIFFDEFDALGTTRDTESSTMKRVIPELLVQIQRAEKSENTLIIIAATNRPWDIDSAFLRPGRFNLSICVPLPDEAARRALINSILNEIPTAEDIDIERIVDKSKGFSGADIVEVCERLKECAIDRIINDGSDEFISNDDVSRVLEYAKSSVREEDLMGVEKYRSQNL